MSASPNQPPTPQAPSGAVVIPETEHQSQPQPSQPPQPSQASTDAAPVVNNPTSGNGPSRRKFTSELDLSLLKEVQAAGAHRAPHGQTLVLFEEVAKHFNAANLVSWKTDGKHCQDRFKLLMTKFRKDDAQKAAASGGAEEYGEYEQLCQDLITEIDDFKQEKANAKSEAAEKETALIAAGEKVRDQAMARASKRGRPDGDGEGTTPKKQKTSHTQAATDMSRAISAVEKAETERLGLLGRQEGRDEKRLELEEKRIALEEHRIETEAIAAEHRNDIEKRRVDLESRRFEEEKKRSEEAATERRLGLEVQRSMLELIREMRSKKG